VPAQTQPLLDESRFPDALVGCGLVAERVREAIKRAAGAPYPVLIEGGIG
jgi:hypothetical protein